MGGAPGGVTPATLGSAPPPGPADGPGDGLVRTVEETLRRHALLDPGARVLVAVSGGADSVALLHVLWLLRGPWRLDLLVGHVHHGLRPEADADAAFVEAYAVRLGCPVVTGRVRIEPGGGRSPEDAARAARHAALGRLAASLGADRIALGHTADDQAETVLMRVLQGAGPRGLAGIPIRRGRLVRPLLQADRAAVRGHLAAHGLAHVEDLTNTDPRFLRNRVRHAVLPALARVAGPGLPVALCRLARASRETVEALEALLAPRLARALHVGPGGWTLVGEALEGLPPGGVRALFRLALTGRTGLSGLRAAHLDALADLIERPRGARVRLPGGLRVERTRAGFFIAPPGPDPGAVTLAGSGATLVPWAWLRVEAVPGAGLGHEPGVLGTSEAVWEATLDADALPGGLEVRPWRAGDRMRLASGPGSIRLSRLLAVAGVARLARSAWPVLAGPDGSEPLWLIGLRRGAGATVTPATRRVLRLLASVAPPG